jgi:hypothetical protein
VGFLSNLGGLRGLMFSRSMGLNLATILAPEGITVNIVSCVSSSQICYGYGVLKSCYSGSTGHDRRYRHDSHPKGNVGVVSSP